MSNPFGIQSVVIRNMKQYARNQYYTNRENFEKDIDKAINMLQKAKKEALKLHDEANNCNHEEFERFETSVRHSLFGFYNHYERTCKKCGLTEAYSDHEEGNSNPEWVKKGLKEKTFVPVYYNNDI